MAYVKKTTAERKDEIREITEKLEAKVAELKTSDKWKEFLSCMAKFHSYSANNVLLILCQKPDATLVAGYSRWKSFGRNVKRGEKGIRILAPAPYRRLVETPVIDESTGSVRRDAAGEPVKEQTEVVVTAFRPVSVFDESQTEGRPLPQVGPEELTAKVDDYQKILSVLEKVSPVPVAFEDIRGGAKGYYDPNENRIALKSGMPELQTIKTLLHEIGHASIHTKEGVEALKSQGLIMDRNEKETQAESIAFVLASGLGIGDTSEYSFPYIAGWTAGKEIDELKESIEVIRNAAHDLITRIDAEMVALQAEERKEPLPESAGRDLKERPSALGELRKLRNSTEISGSPEKGMGEQWRKQEKTATSRSR